VFVSGPGGAGQKAGIAVLQRAEGRTALARMVPVGSAASGMAMTHDGRLLVVAASDEVVFPDVERMTSGAGNPVLGSFRDGSGAGSVYANITADDKLLFVSDERRHAITVIDLERARANGYKAGAIIGAIPAGNAPIALTFPPDGKWLYTTSEGALPEWNWPKDLQAAGTRSRQIAERESAGRGDRSGCGTRPNSPGAGGRGAHSRGLQPGPAGDFTRRRAHLRHARNNDAVLAFDTAKLLSDPGHARVGSAPVGSAPVPVALIEDGRKVVVGNSNRFAGSHGPQSLTVLDAARIEQGAAATLGTIPAGAFPREMAVSADGRTLFLTNFGSQSLQVIDVTHLPLAK